MTLRRFASQLKGKSEKRKVLVWRISHMYCSGRYNNSELRIPNLRLWRIVVPGDRGAEPRKIMPTNGCPSYKEPILAWPA